MDTTEKTAHDLEWPQLTAHLDALKRHCHALSGLKPCVMKCGHGLFLSVWVAVGMRYRG
jgi:hypothetical protein